MLADECLISVTCLPKPAVELYQISCSSSEALKTTSDLSETDVETQGSKRMLHASYPPMFLRLPRLPEGAETGPLNGKWLGVVRRGGSGSGSRLKQRQCS